MNEEMTLWKSILPNGVGTFRNDLREIVDRSGVNCNRGEKWVQLVSSVSKICSKLTPALGLRKTRLHFQTERACLPHGKTLVGKDAMTAVSKKAEYTILDAMRKDAQSVACN